LIAIVLANLLIEGCAVDNPGLPVGDAAAKLMPPLTSVDAIDRYPIKPGDEVSVDVFDEPGLSMDKLPVDEAGRIQMPLVGSIRVAGMSPADASKTIQDLLGTKYLRDPKVAVNVSTPAEQLVSVEGQVTKAGTYPISPDTTLLGAIAMAQSPTRIARLSDVVVFRVTNGERTAARFNLKSIRSGRDPDPRILGGDVVVVGFSTAKSIYRDVLTAAPFFNIFTRF
jgi:polysaccharide export outer membrane protein